MMMTLNLGMKLRITGGRENKKIRKLEKQRKEKSKH